MSRKQRDRSNFQAKPEEGWTHNTAALAVGHGVYYSFPVKYIGSIQVMQSLSRAPMADKTAVCWEAIGRCVDAAGLRKKKKRKVSKVVKSFLADSPYVKVMELKINLSVEGIATSDLGTNEIISNDDIKKISFAAGGQSNDYDFVTYVAKDKRDNRYCHVFDCSILADDVLATIGQIFSLLTSGGGGGDGDAPDLAGDAQVAAAVIKGANAPPVGNPLYDAMAGGKLSSGGSVRNAPRGAGSSNPSYDEAEGGSATYDNPEGDDQYGEIDEAQGAQFAAFLNDNADALGDQPLYGEIDGSIAEATYGAAAEPGWGYLDVKPDEDLYGGLADVFVDE